MLVHRARDSDFKFQVAGRMPPARRPTWTGSSSPFVTAPARAERSTDICIECSAAACLFAAATAARFQVSVVGEDNSFTPCGVLYLWLKSRAEKTNVPFRMDHAIAPDRRFAAAQRNESIRYLFCHSAARTQPEFKIPADSESDEVSNCLAS